MGRAAARGSRQPPSARHMSVSFLQLCQESSSPAQSALTFPPWQREHARRERCSVLPFPREGGEGSQMARCTG